MQRSNFVLQNLITETHDKSLWIESHSLFSTYIKQIRQSMRADTILHFSHFQRTFHVGRFCPLCCSVVPAVHGFARSRPLCVLGMRGKRAQGGETPWTYGTRIRGLWYKWRKSTNFANPKAVRIPNPRPDWTFNYTFNFRDESSLHVQLRTPTGPFWDPSTFVPRVVQCAGPTKMPFPVVPLSPKSRPRVSV